MGHTQGKNIQTLSPCPVEATAQIMTPANPVILQTAVLK